MGYHAIDNKRYSGKNMIDDSPLGLLKRVLKLIYREGRAIPLNYEVREKVQTEHYTLMRTSLLSKRLNEIERETKDQLDTKEIIRIYHNYVGLSLEDLEVAFLRMNGRPYGGGEWAKAARAIIDLNEALPAVTRESGVSAKENADILLEFLRGQHPVVQSKDSALSGQLVRIPYRKTHGWPQQYFPKDEE